jgi:hypothetical protein
MSWLPPSLASALTHVTTVIQRDLGEFVSTVQKDTTEAVKTVLEDGADGGSASGAVAGVVGGGTMSESDAAQQQPQQRQLQQSGAGGAAAGGASGGASATALADGDLGPAAPATAVGADLTPAVIDQLSAIQRLQARMEAGEEEDLGWGDDDTEAAVPSVSQGVVDEKRGE